MARSGSKPWITPATPPHSALISASLWCHAAYEKIKYMEGPVVRCKGPSVLCMGPMCLSAALRRRWCATVSMDEPGPNTTLATLDEVHTHVCMRQDLSQQPRAAPSPLCPKPAAQSNIADSHIRRWRSRQLVVSITAGGPDHRRRTPAGGAGAAEGGPGAGSAPQERGHQPQGAV